MKNVYRAEIINNLCIYDTDGIVIEERVESQENDEDFENKGIRRIIRRISKGKNRSHNRKNSEKNKRNLF